MAYQIGDKLRRTTDAENPSKDTQKDSVYEVVKVDPVRLSGCGGMYTNPYLTANFEVTNPQVATIETTEGSDLTLRNEEGVATYTAGIFTGTYAEAAERAADRVGYMVALNYLQTIANKRGLLAEPKVELGDGVVQWDNDEGTVYLKLFQGRQGQPNLKAVNPDGSEMRSGYLMEFKKNKVVTNIGVNSDVQMPRKGSCIKIGD